jgi:hypothetical protein
MSRRKSPVNLIFYEKRSGFHRSFSKWPRRVRAAHSANNSNHFLPRRVRGKKYYSVQQVPKARSEPQSFLAEKS